MKELKVSKLVFISPFYYLKVYPHYNIIHKKIWKVILYSCDILFKSVNKQNHGNYPFIFWHDYCWENHPSKLLHEREHDKHASKDLFCKVKISKRTTEIENQYGFALYCLKSYDVQMKQKCRVNHSTIVLGSQTDNS